MLRTDTVYIEDQQRSKGFWAEKVDFEVVADHPMGPKEKAYVVPIFQ
ncbi:VOC family protein [Peribacillus butanolivorans]